MYLVRTSAGITFEYFFSTPSKLFFEKPEIFASLGGSKTSMLCKEIISYIG